ncbi:glucose-6-phosphate dehydrogenase [Ligilactobacillus murinus]|uniref:glucose-6-phosphate dehydrogenase n=1 Tax=Ligilactobacillus murinus TaxID=1622 RepID=UPI0012984EAC|nr:glucose-6-phosphate dehydrogenase [Ligilactobacillus murinus]
MKVVLNLAKKEQKALFVIFGGTGDLAQRKLYPALFDLYKRGYLKKHFAVIGTARRPWSNGYYRDVVRSSIDGMVNSQTQIDEFASHFYYQSHNVNDVDHYETLRVLADKLDQDYGLEGNRLYYLAMSPSFFGTICEHLKSQGLTKTTGYNRVIIEKPFGHDYASAKKLNDEISKYFPEEATFRIDHYLGKEMIQNIMALRFGNSILSAIWNNKMISNIQVTLSESLGVEERGGYYDTAGALRDMVQNHILQIVALLVMDRPDSYCAKDVRKRKVETFEALKIYSPKEVAQNFVRGQYGAGKDMVAYREESMIAPDSMTETFVAGKLEVDNCDMAGVPIYIRTGKRLAMKATRVDIVFKKDDESLFGGQGLADNILTINVEPDTGIDFTLNTKKIGQEFATRQTNIGYRLTKEQVAKVPEAYERLILNALQGNSVNFTHWDELEYSWKFVDAIRNAWDQEDLPVDYFPNYACGTMGPQASDELLAKAGHHWIF